MYSILLRLQNSTSAKRYKFLVDNQGAPVLFNTIEEVEEKVQELMDTYLIHDIEVVKKCVITSLISVEEMEPEENEVDGE